MQWLLDRLKEPSTWQGIATFAAAVGISFSPEMWVQIGTIAAAVIGLIQMIKKEKETPPPT